MDRNETQRNQIRALLLQGGSITPKEAYHAFGCFRLAAQIFELRKEFPIETETVKGDNGKRWAKYYIKRSYFTSGRQLQLF